MRSTRFHFDHRANVHRSVVVFGAVAAVMANAGFRLNAGAPTSQVMVVDIIPEVLSGETDTNCEPSLGVNPANPLQIAASAWVPEPMGGKTTPIFISRDGGKAWSCRSTVPVNQETADKTLQFGGLLNMLYLATVKGDYELKVCRSDQFAMRRMEIVGQLGGKGVDQPYFAAARTSNAVAPTKVNKMVNNTDRVFIGCNDWNGPSGFTATIFRSLNGTGTSPGFTPRPIEFRTGARDSSEIRPAVSADGTKVYAVFNRVAVEGSCTRFGGVILVRDDNGGDSGAASFSALRDQTGVPGLPVVKDRMFAWNALLGRDRLGGDLAIAVDPRDANVVYLVWGELVQAQPVLHVIRSGDGGTKWSDPLRTVTNVKNPGLAMNATGTLAFLYQQVVTLDGEETWITKLERTKNDFKDVDTKKLSKFPVSEVKIDNGQPQLGDYLQLTSIGNDFYGIFPASNVPDDSRFDECGITFQRRTDRKAKKLLGLHGEEVEPSIDPFFFRVTNN